MRGSAVLRAIGPAFGALLIGAGVVRAAEAGPALSDLLQRFLVAQASNPESSLDTDVVSIELPSAQGGTNLYVMPRSTAKEFVHLLMSGGRYADVETVCRSYIRGSTTPDGFPHYRLGVVMELDGRAGEAASAYQHAIEQTEKPQHALLPLFRAWGLAAHGASAAPDAAEAAWQRYSETLAKLSDAERASAVKMILEEAFGVGLHHLNGTRKFPEAKKEFQMALKIEPDNEQAKLNLILADLNQSIQSSSPAQFDAAVAALKDLAATAKEPRVLGVARQTVDRADSIRQQAFGAAP